MGDVILWPLQASRSHAACSAGSAARHSGKSADVVRLELPPGRIRAGSDPAASISRSGRTPPRTPARPAHLSPKSKRRVRSPLCLESLALRDSIMDDKSMQPWIDSQLTPGAAPRTIVRVGRPKDVTSPATYNAQFIARVRAARQLYTNEPKEMARALGIREDTYYRYEKRTMMPHHLLPKFCELTGISVERLISGPPRPELRVLSEKTG